MSSVSVLVIAVDERWREVLEATLRIGGYTPITRRSVDEAVKLRSGDPPPKAVVLDLGRDVDPDEVGVVRGLLAQQAALSAGAENVIVILPEDRADQRDRFLAAGSGIEVIVRPYPPSVLYAALAARATG